jgi:hypothetical protein
VCQICKTAFCKSCGTPFLCRNCFSLLDVNAQGLIHQQSEQYKSRVGGGIAMTAIGAVLLEIGAYALYFGATLIVILIGLGLFIGGLSTLGSSKAKLLRTVSLAAAHVGSSGFAYPASASSIAGESWSIGSAAIPQSAFIPVLQEVPPQPASIPASAYVPEPKPTPAAPATLAPKGEAKRAAAGTYENVQFCGQCGEKLPDVADLRFCPACGASR